VLVLDEPTSALDPASRTRVAELLKQWKISRLVITISHDAEFVRQADDVRLMESGRLAASGTFEQLRQESEVFRRTLRQT
jgi:ABC-type bacteriocin/lantibiotic exporter with double-glycine peptidase domain